MHNGSGLAPLAAALNLRPAISVNHAFTTMSEKFEPWLAIRADVGQIKDDMSTVKQRLTSVEVQIAHLHGDLAIVHTRIDGVEKRLDRIERRLQLTSV